jgi:hypothetical protein
MGDARWLREVPIRFRLRIGGHQNPLNPLVRVCAWMMMFHGESSARLVDCGAHTDSLCVVQCAKTPKSTSVKLKTGLFTQ